jgi:DNA topoisomerase-2
VNEDDKIVKDKVKYVPGFLRIFIEVLSNAVDNVWRSKYSSNKKYRQTFIEIEVDPSTGRTMVHNNGKPIPIIFNKKEKMLNPELIFGTLLTSSNYDDDQIRGTSGRNGYGVKLTNIFSTIFKVVCNDGEYRFIQTFGDNMSRRNPAKITESKRAPCTKVTYYPDFSRFKGLDKYTDDIISVMKKLAYDAAMFTGITVKFNGDEIFVKTLRNYVDMYPYNTGEILTFKTEDSKVALVGTTEAFYVTFVNGVYTENGGVHYELWRSRIMKEVIKLITKRLKTKMTLRDIKCYFGIFIVCNLVNPEFKGQDKAELTSPPPNVPKTLNLIRVMKWKFLDHLENLLRVRDLKKLKQSDAKKNSHLSVDNLDDANLAGTSHSVKCSLFITEGLSAKTFARRMISNLPEGSDLHGVYPIRGKFLNTRNANTGHIAKNTEVSDLKKALGLKYDVDYANPDNFRTLRYGKLQILADADLDGIHIGGLLINFIHSLFPSLLPLGFVQVVRTPIVKLTIRGNITPIYDQIVYEEVYKKYRQKNIKFSAQYYKGLGTYSPDEIKEYTTHPVYAQVMSDEGCDEAINLAFNDKRSNDRKTWLLNYDRDRLVPIEPGDDLCVSMFVHNELIRFSMDDNTRAIPSLLDGLKPTQRKIIYSTFKRNLDQLLKVAQFAGYVAEHTSYKHGEQSVSEAIIHMGRDFVGSNNIPFFLTKGNFGTRLEGGKDATAPRYIFVRLNPIMKYLFIKDDEQLLDRLDEDGQLVEPKCYLPILPYVLINGASGIGTGFSTDIPCFNPLDVVNAVRHCINDEEWEDIVPWYAGYKGIITPEGKSVTTHGIFEKEWKTHRGFDIARVTELPVGFWTSKFKVLLDKLVHDGKIHSCKKYDNVENFEFHIYYRQSMANNVTWETLRLTRSISLNNMVMFDERDVPHRYESVREIIEEFCKIRLFYYTRRKKILLKNLEEKYMEQEGRVLYIEGVINGEIKLLGQSEKGLIDNLLARKFYKKKNSFDYLLDMPNRTLTSKRVVELKSQLEKIVVSMKELKSKKPKQLWLDDLEMFEKEYKKIYVRKK